jgi:hypothetical protein
MTAHVFGIDICDYSTSIVSYADDKAFRFPTAICKEKDADGWYVGEEAYAMALSGRGVIVDKLLNLTIRGGTATLNGVKYQGAEILKYFLRLIIDISLEKLKVGYPDKIVVSIPKIDIDIVERITSCLVDLGYLKQNIKVISRCESFIYYVMSQGKEIWNNQVGLFSLTDAKLTYYELKVSKTSKRFIVYAESKDMDEGFNLDLLNNSAGAKMGDKILTACADRILKKKVFSTIMLTEKGFENLDWAVNFKKIICSRRRVFVDMDLFARGACVRAVDLISDKPIFNFTCICDGRLDTDISINIQRKDKEVPLMLAKAGEAWNEAKASFRIIADSVPDIELHLEPIDIYKKKRSIKIPLNFMPARPQKAMRLDIKTEFKNAVTMVLSLEDAGFGDLYKKSEAGMVQEVDLWD